MKRKLKMGMVGGGPGAFIGDIHRKASGIDGKIEIVAGAFDIDPEKSRQMGESLCISPDRTYNDYKEMIQKELALPEGERVDFVSVTTPNNWHFPIAKDFLEAGFNVMCEKPMTLNVEEARQLKEIVEKSGKIFCLMHNYTGYPMVKLARDMIKKGSIGKVLKIVVEYSQGWLIRPIEKTGQKQAAWRTDPKQSGAGGAMGDIGSHAENLAEYITGLKITEICADLTSFVDGRILDDDGNCLLRFENGARGILHASQVCAGRENDLKIWIYGEDKSLEWHQEDPNKLIVRSIDEPMQIWTRGNDYVASASPAAARASRLPGGHPEAFLEAFANNYSNFAEAIFCQIEGREPGELDLDFPDVNDGLRGMIFIETVVKAGKNDEVKWVKFEN